MLGITRRPFDEINGNVQGFAHQREIAVSSIAELPLKTTLHEIAHVVLGHTTSQKFIDLEHIDRNIQGSRGGIRGSHLLRVARVARLRSRTRVHSTLAARREGNSQSVRSSDFHRRADNPESREAAGGEAVGSSSFFPP